jgi:serine/threonine protein kinase
MTVAGFRNESTLWEDRVSQVLSATRESDGKAVQLVVFAEASSAKIEELLREVGHLGALNSFHILSCLEAGTTDIGATYLVYPQPQGPSLHEVLTAQGSLKTEVVCSVGLQIARTMSAVHAMGITHGDLSSKNIYMAGAEESPIVQISRFGVRHLLPPYTRNMQTPHFHGTAGIMAPEICGGKPADHRADLYSLGILFYEMVTGKAPFVSKSYTTTLKRQIYEKPLPLHLVKPGMANIASWKRSSPRPSKRIRTNGTKAHPTNWPTWPNFSRLIFRTLSFQTISVRRRTRCRRPPW